MPQSIIEVENLSKRYRLGQFNAQTLREEIAHLLRPRSGNGAAAEAESEFWALRGVSFTVAPGEVLGIIGRNGAGKSTLLKILSRVTEPTSGSARIRGRVASLLEVGTGFHPDLTGRENIYLNGAILGMTRAEIGRKFDEIVDFSGVEKFLDTPVKRYSSGMYVRLAFAIAAHLDPEILIVDEVLAVGDGEFQAKCLGRMRSVSSKEGRTVLFVSHNMTAIANLCDTAMLLSHGRLTIRDNARRVVNEYVSTTLSSLSATDNLYWPDIKSAPGNDDIRIQRVKLNSSADGIFLSSEIGIEISYWNVSSKNILLDVVVYSADGSPVFEDLSANDPEWQGRRIPRGLVKTTLTIPPGLLNEGTFKVRVLFCERDAVTRLIYDLDDLIFFDVVDTEERTVNWSGKFLGPVRPKLGWSTQLISEKF